MRRPAIGRSWALAAAAAVLVLAVGAVGSLLGALAVAHNDGSKARQSFQLAATGIGATLQLAIQREQALSVSASTFFAAHPQPSAGEFERWAQWSGAARRYPELERLALVALRPLTPLQAALVTAQAGLTSSQAAARASGSRVAQGASAPRSSSTRLAGGARLVRVGTQAYACSTVGEVGHGADGGADRDCLLTPTLLLTRDAGQTRYRSSAVGSNPALVLDTPVYRGNATPLSRVGRRAAFVGWLREVLLPRRMLQNALRGAPAEGLRLRFRTASSALLFTGGAAGAGAQSVAVDLHGGWSARVLGPSVQAGVLGNGNSLTVLLLGLLASVLAGALIFALGNSGERDGERQPASAAVPAIPPQPPDGLYDPLTGVPSRALTLDRADCMLARVGRQSGMLTGALLIDVDWFKDINEKLGREAGDQLLRVVAERLQRVVRADDTVGRLDGDKFVALVESQARGVKLESLAGRMIEALHEPVELEGFGPSFHMTASIGVAFGRYSRTEDLLGDTQVALDAAKAAGKDRFTLFNANLRSVIEDRGVLDSELNAALQDKQFFLLYQPVYDLSRERVVALDAQIRWMHPKRGVVAPVDFLDTAEETALIVPIGRWALEEACTRAAAWNAEGHELGISVKASAAQLSRDGFASDVRRALQQSGIAPAALTLEIPEAAVIADVDAAATRLSELKQLGVRVAIGEFGNGYAYRSDLQRLPLDFLKVDRSSVASSDDEDYRSWLLEAIVLFARDLSLSVIVAQVETAEQLAALRRIGCTMVQGPLVGDPVQLDAVVPALEVALPALEEPLAAASQPSTPMVAVEGQPVAVGVPAAPAASAAVLEQPRAAASETALATGQAAPAPSAGEPALAAGQAPPGAAAPSAPSSSPAADPPNPRPDAPAPGSAGSPGSSAEPTVIIDRPPSRG